VSSGAVSYPWAVVVHLDDAALADAAVVRAGGLVRVATDHHTRQHMHTTRMSHISPPSHDSTPCPCAPSRFVSLSLLFCAPYRPLPISFLCPTYRLQYLRTCLRPSCAFLPSSALPQCSASSGKGSAFRGTAPGSVIMADTRHTYKVRTGGGEGEMGRSHHLKCDSTDGIPQRCQSTYHCEGVSKTRPSIHILFMYVCIPLTWE
jgi:hypothetical protein